MKQEREEEKGKRNRKRTEKKIGDKRRKSGLQERREERA